MFPHSFWSPKGGKKGGGTSNFIWFGDGDLRPLADLSWFSGDAAIAKGSWPYHGPCAGALADESPKSKIIQKCQNVNWPWDHQKSNLRKWQTPLKVSARRAGLESGVKMVDSWVIWWVFEFFKNRNFLILLFSLIFLGLLGLWPHGPAQGPSDLPNHGPPSEWMSIALAALIASTSPPRLP